MTLGLFLVEQVTEILSDVIEEVHPERKIIQGEILDIDESLDPDMEFFEYSILTHEGAAKFMSHQGDDIPRVSANISRRRGKQEEIGVGYALTERELSLANKRNVPLERLHMKSAKVANDQLIEDTAYLGNTDLDLKGWLNYPNLPQYITPADGTGASTRVFDKTPEQNYRDLHRFISSKAEDTKLRFAFDYIYAPTEIVNYWANTLLTGSNAGGRTILQVVMANQKLLGAAGIKGIIACPYLSGRGTGGTDLIMGMRKDFDYARVILSRYFQVDPATHPVRRKWNVDITSVTGGTLITQPLAISRWDGV